MDKNSNQVRTVHYLGSKMRMLSAIKDAIDDVDPTNGKVCDLFCGSAIVSEYLLQYRDVMAVDIQNYSKVYCEAGLTGIRNTPPVSSIIKSIKASACRTKNIKEYMSLLIYEEECIAKAKTGEIESLYEIIEKGSLYAFLNGLQYDDGKLSPKLSENYSTIKNILLQNNDADSLNSIITRYYGGLYYSYRQAIDIDAIASYAFSQDEPLKSKILASLMGAATDAVNTVGKQFAQPLKVRKKDGELKRSLLHKILADRSIDIFEKFNQWLSYYFNRPMPEHNFNIACDDYVNALKSIANSEIKVIYADPPYTRYHYSRFYHILETICLHDNPAISTTFPNGKGGLSRAIYRDDRYQSTFCIKSKAPGAFEDLFKYSRQTGAGLVLSYSPYDKNSGATPRLLSIDQLVQMAKKYYSDVTIKSPGTFMHSRLNSVDKNYEINYEAERLIICKI